MRFQSLADRNMKEIYRDPISSGLGLGLPALMLVLFISIGKNAQIEIFTVNMLTPGVIVFGFAFLTMFSGILLTKDRGSAFLARLLTTPLRSTDFILSYVLPYLVLAVLQILVCFLVGVAFGIELEMSAVLSLVVLVPLAAANIGIGMIVGSLCTENQVAGIGSIVIVTMSLFSGAWMDLKVVGGVFETIGYALPFAHGIDAARAVLSGAGLGDIIRDLYWVLAYTAAFLILGVLAFKWKTKR